jgi:hypothetical protein
VAAGGLFFTVVPIREHSGKRGGAYGGVHTRPVVKEAELSGGAHTRIDEVVPKREQTHTVLQNLQGGAHMRPIPVRHVDFI